MSTPTEDQRKRADKFGRNLHQCAACKRSFWIHGEFGSMLGRRITLCGVLLDPPECRCLLTDDYGNWWWPQGEPLPDLFEIDRANRAAGQPMR